MTISDFIIYWSQNTARLEDWEKFWELKEYLYGQEN